MGDFKSFDTILPNLKYINKVIYFCFKDPIRLKISGNNCVKDKLPLINIDITSKLKIKDLDVVYLINEYEHREGLKINIKYYHKSAKKLDKYDLQKLAHDIEGIILRINNQEKYCDENLSIYESNNEYCDNNDQYNNQYGDNQYGDNQYGDNQYIDDQYIDDQYEDNKYNNEYNDQNNNEYSDSEEW
jgi:hypothetical protein